MKRQLKFYLFLYMMTSIAALQASLFQIAIPQDLVKKNATLLLLVCDNKGQQSFRKCCLGKTRTYTITQEELEFATENEQTNDVAMEIFAIASTMPDLPYEESIVVCFQLDSQFQVLRVMVLKDCLLDNDPFDIVTLPISSEVEFEQLYEEIQGVDELEKLTNDLEYSDLSNLSQNENKSWIEEYMLYAKIFTAMQYHKVKKVMDLSGWWN